MTALLTYFLLTSALLGLAAAAAEAALRARGRSARWVWTTSMAVSATLPLVIRLAEALRPETPVAGAPPLVAPVLAPLTVGSPSSASWWPADQTLALAWAVVTLILAVRLLLSWVSLRESARRWSRRNMDGVPVWVSKDTGPATVGVLRPDIVVPRWALSLNPIARRLMLAHEREHLRGGDPMLLLLGMVTLLALPWNLPLWWQYRRLRLAVELDCDARVLRTEGSPLAYGRLLLEVGRRRSGFPMLAVALAERRSFLEQRIRRLARVGLGGGPVRVLALSLAAVALLTLAVCTPGPFAPDAPEPAIPRTAATVDDPAPAGPAAGDTVLPRLLNPAEVAERLEASYPPTLREAGIGGQTQLWLYVDTTGLVTRTQVDRTSGRQELDMAALGVADVLRLEPARADGEAVAMWIRLPFTFRSAAGRGQAPDTSGWMKGVQLKVREDSVIDPAPATPKEAAPTDPLQGVRPPVSAPEDLAAEPVFTPYEEAPELRNRDEVVRALETYYPPLLRDAGIGGTTIIWFFIDETGRVVKTSVNRTSGHQALDQAALRVAETMEFTPALNRDRPVHVWVMLPLTFRAR